jgi:hypothetical protein
MAARAAILALLALAPAAAFVGPSLDRLWLSRSAADLVRANTAPNAAIAVSGYDEPSLVFLLGTATKIVPGDAAARFLMAAPGAMVRSIRRWPDWARRLMSSAASPGSIIPTASRWCSPYTRRRELQRVLAGFLRSWTTAVLLPAQPSASRPV